MSTNDTGWYHFIALLAHELRNPVGVITGYQELLADGIYGTLDDRGTEALARIGSAGEQLLALLDGANELTQPGHSLKPDVSPADIASVIARALDGACQLAAGRGATLVGTAPTQLPQLATDPERLLRVLDLALGAAVRASPGETLAFSVQPLGDDACDILVAGSALDPVRDDPALEVAPDAPNAPAISTAAGLRLAMARRLAASIGCEVDLLPGPGSTTLRVRLRSAIDEDKGGP